MDKFLLNEEIKKFRKSRGWSQYKLAEKIYLNQNKIKSAEAGTAAQYEVYHHIRYHLKEDLLKDIAPLPNKFLDLFYEIFGKQISEVVKGLSKEEMEEVLKREMDELREERRKNNKK